MKAAETPDFISIRDKLDCLPVYMDSAEYDRYLKDLWVRTEKMLKDVAIIKEPATQPY
jgi:tripartite-type tricarboxylate transporter receptor subunit TctC